MGKRNNEHLYSTPLSTQPKSSRLLLVEDIHQTIEALAKKYPADDLIRDLQSGFEKLGGFLEAMTTIESAEEKERKRSIVVIGLPENNSTDSIERADADSTSVVDMLRSLNIQTRPDKVYRMGRPPTHSNAPNNGPSHSNSTNKGPRLLKVVLPSSQLQRQTLSSLKSRRPDLRKIPGFQRAIVRPSLSPDELIKDRELRARLKTVRDKNPGTKLFIRNGQIVADGGGPVDLN
jgi:hypothetical protein